MRLGVNVVVCSIGMWSGSFSLPKQTLKKGERCSTLLISVRQLLDKSSCSLCRSVNVLMWRQPTGGVRGGCASQLASWHFYCMNCDELEGSHLKSLCSSFWAWPVNVLWLEMIRWCKNKSTSHTFILYFPHRSCWFQEGAPLVLLGELQPPNTNKLIHLFTSSAYIQIWRVNSEVLVC